MPPSPRSDAGAPPDSASAIDVGVRSIRIAANFPAAPRSPGATGTSSLTGQDKHGTPHGSGMHTDGAKSAAQGVTPVLARGSDSPDLELYHGASEPNLLNSTPVRPLGSSDTAPLEQLYIAVGSPGDPAAYTAQYGHPTSQHSSLPSFSGHRQPQQQQQQQANQQERAPSNLQPLSSPAANQSSGDDFYDILQQELERIEKHKNRFLGLIAQTSDQKKRKFYVNQLDSLRAKEDKIMEDMMGEGEQIPELEDMPAMHGPEAVSYPAGGHERGESLQHRGPGHQQTLAGNAALEMNARQAGTVHPAPFAPGRPATTDQTEPMVTLGARAPRTMPNTMCTVSDIESGMVTSGGAVDTEAPMDVDVSEGPGQLADAGKTPGAAGDDVREDPQLPTGTPSRGMQDNVGDMDRSNVTSVQQGPPADGDRSGMPTVAGVESDLTGSSGSSSLPATPSSAAGNAASAPAAGVPESQAHTDDEGAKAGNMSVHVDQVAGSANVTQEAQPIQPEDGQADRRVSSSSSASQGGAHVARISARNALAGSASGPSNDERMDQDRDQLGAGVQNTEHGGPDDQSGTNTEIQRLNTEYADVGNEDGTREEGVDGDGPECSEGSVDNENDGSDDASEYFECNDDPNAVNADSERSPNPDQGESGAPLSPEEQRARKKKELNYRNKQKKKQSKGTKSSEPAAKRRLDSPHGTVGTSAEGSATSDPVAEEPKTLLEQAAEPRQAPLSDPESNAGVDDAEEDVNGQAAGGKKYNLRRQRAGAADQTKSYANAAASSAAPGASADATAGPADQV